MDWLVLIADIEIMTEQDYETFKIVMIGDSGTGKSTLVRSLIHGENFYFSNSSKTIGLEFAAKEMTMSNRQKINMHIWDTSGHESYRNIIKP